MVYPIRTEKLTKSYRILPSRSGRLSFLSYFGRRQKLLALNRISIKVKEGEIYGLLGPNGSGKTTLIRLLTTVVLPDSGTAYINGLDICDEKNKYQISRNVGVVLGERSRAIYWRLTARKNLEFYGTLHEIPKQELRKKIDEVLELVGLAARKDDYVYHFSTGMRCRLAIARALLHDPSILLLDDPTLSLDPMGAYELREKIKNMAKQHGKTILFATHHIYEAEDLCDRIGILNYGRLVTEGTKAQLKKKMRRKFDNIVIELERPLTGLQKSLERIKDVRTISTIENIIKIKAKHGGKVIAHIIDALDRYQAQVVNFRLEEPSLKDVFMRAVKNV